MIFADKLIKLRKKNGWSQEEFAEKMGVSRQAVSKWEGAQTVPDLEKILQMAKLFGVTTDYLLKDEIEQEEHTGDGDAPMVKKISLATAHEYLAWRAEAAKKIALGVFLCIISVLPLLLLGGASEAYGLSGNVAGGVGLIVLFLVIAGAVAIFVHCGFQNAPYEFMEKEPYESEYGVDGMVKEKQKDYRPIYAKTNMIGVCMCVLSPIPLFMGAFMQLDDFWMVTLVCVMFLVIAVAVYLFVRVGVRWGAMQRLLHEGEFKNTGKVTGALKESVEGAYWCTVTAGYLLWSFLTSDWHISWVVWPVAAVLFGAIEAVLTYLESRKK
ncbi:MAG: helix-turn-helix transcriptional regulator [Clostridia bacterium]|nr:helix-turn-helix transcriptional regulator [Clostridia bacterium]